MYRTIAASFWTDPKVKTLTPEGKLLLLYFITNPHSHVSGIYILPRTTRQHETGLSLRALDTLSDTLSRLGICAFDAQIEAVWVRKMLSYQGRGDKNYRSAAAHVEEDLHNSLLCKAFLDFYPEVRAHTKKGYYDTLSDTLSDRVSRVGTPEQDQEQDTLFPIPDQDQEQDGEGSRKPYGEFGYAKLSDSEHSKLLVKLNGNFENFVQQFDSWVAEAPNAKHKGVRRKDRNPYASIGSWFDRAVREGTLHNGQRESAEEAKIRRTKEAGERLLRRLASQDSSRISD